MTVEKQPLDLVNRDDLIDLTQELVSIPSQYIENECIQHDEITEYLAEYMDNMGLEVQFADPEKDFPVIVGATQDYGEGPTIGVLGHYSTVAIGDENDWSFDPLGGEVVDGNLYGRGSADQKGGIAAALMATQNLLESDVQLNGQLKLIMLPGEGSTQAGLGPAAKHHPDIINADAYIDSDSGPDRVSLAYGGLIWLELQTEGTPVHSGYVTDDGEVPINPAEKLIDVLSKIKTADWMEAEHHPLFGPESGRYTRDPIVDINVVQAGDKVNQVPATATAQIDIRPLPSQTIEGVLEELDDVLEEMRTKDPDLEVETQIINAAKNDREVDQNAPIVQLILETCEELDSPEPNLVGVSSSGRPELTEFGPVIGFGAGGGNNVHAADEHIPVDRLVQGCKLHTLLYTKLMTHDASSNLLDTQ